MWCGLKIKVVGVLFSDKAETQVTQCIDEAFQRDAGVKDQWINAQTNSFQA